MEHLCRGYLYISHIVTSVTTYYLRSCNQQIRSALSNNSCNEFVGIVYSFCAYELDGIHVVQSLISAVCFVENCSGLLAFPTFFLITVVFTLCHVTIGFRRLYGMYFEHRWMRFIDLWLPILMSLGLRWIVVSFAIVPHLFFVYCCLSLTYIMIGRHDTSKQKIINSKH